MSLKDPKDTSLLIDHYRNPRCRGLVDSPDFRHEVVNRKCGDKLSFTVRLKKGKLAGLKFEGEGCFYCLASASIACSELTGSDTAVAGQKTAQVRSWLGGDDSQAPDPAEPELSALGEIKAYPMRIGCVDLAWKGIQELLHTCAEDGRE